jgi:hypothetical protein
MPIFTSDELLLVLTKKIFVDFYHMLGEFLPLKTEGPVGKQALR